MASQPMSMEAFLDEERRMVLELIDPTAPRARANAAMRTPSPQTSPRAHFRSMLDIDDDTPQTTTATPFRPSQPTTVRSMLDIDSAPVTKVRSMLDVDSPPSSAQPTRTVFSNPPSPVLPKNKLANNNNYHASHPRSVSDASSKPVGFGPKSRTNTRLDPTSEYQFGDYDNAGPPLTLPRRTVLGKNALKTPSALSQALRSSDYPPLSGEIGRHHSIAGPSMRTNNKSMSPHSRLGLRSKSPATSLGRTKSPVGTSLLADSTAPLDMNNAYRKLSDAHLAMAGGSLGEFGLKRTKNNDRMVKDYVTHEEGAFVDDSSDERDDDDSSDDELERGRQTARSFEGTQSSFDAKGKSPMALQGGASTRQSLSLLAAAEEERMQVAKKQPSPHPGYRSLFDEPEITVTDPSGEKVKQPKPNRIHPATSFDEVSPIGNRTPTDANEEDDEAQLTDIKRAQRMHIQMTPIMTTPGASRALRIIYRGEYARIVQEAQDDHRHLRKYLCATDLSDESAHALEWAVGTCLRDGDTLIAIYCVDEDTGIPQAEGQEAAEELKPRLGSVAGGLQPHGRGPASIRASEGSVSPAPSTSGGTPEEQRARAVKDITDRVTRLLRKTKLQVRVIVEVLHCKNPRHLITEVIDTISPTLVILGSRGRSALKGVILGSFSNYLVTKSSVPVMVARKRLKKQSKYKRPAVNQVNNLNNPAARLLENAKVD